MANKHTLPQQKVFPRSCMTFIQSMHCGTCSWKSFVIEDQYKEVSISCVKNFACDSNSNNTFSQRLFIMFSLKLNHKNISFSERESWDLPYYYGNKNLNH